MKKIILNKYLLIAVSIGVLATAAFGTSNSSFFSANTLNGMVAVNYMTPPTPAAPTLKSITFVPAYHDTEGWYYGDIYHVSWEKVSNVDYYVLLMRKLPAS